MASAWGKSWGLAFGAAWGLVVAVPPVQDDASGGAAVEQRHAAPTVHPAYEQQSLRSRVNVHDYAKTHAQDAPNVDTPAVPATPAGSAGSEIGVGAQPLAGAIAPFKRNQPSAPVYIAPIAINLVASEGNTDHGNETAQAVQAAQERQQAEQAALLRRQDEELALIMILLEATAS